VHFALKMLWLKAQQLATILKCKMANGKPKWRSNWNGQHQN